MSADINELVKRLRGHKRPYATHHEEVDCNAAADALEAMAGEVGALKHDIARHMTIANEAAAERNRLKAVGQKLLAKFDHPTASVTQWDVDELRKALGGDA